MKIKMHITTDGADGVYIITYKASKFQKLECKRGKVSEQQFKALMQIVPPVIQELEEFQKKYERVSYEVITDESSSLYKILLDKYHNWYINQTGIAPKIDAITGMQLKKIISYLKNQTASEEEIIIIFQLILEKWDTLPDFYRNQREIRQINSNLNIILNHCKNGQSDSKSKARNLSDDMRKSI